MGGGLPADCGRKSMVFSAPFEAFSGIKNAIGFSPRRNQIIEFWLIEQAIYCESLQTMV